MFSAQLRNHHDSEYFTWAIKPLVPLLVGRNYIALVQPLQLSEADSSQTRNIFAAESLAGGGHVGLGLASELGYSAASAGDGTIGVSIGAIRGELSLTTTPISRTARRSSTEIARR